MSYPVRNHYESQYEDYSTYSDSSTNYESGAMIEDFDQEYGATETEFNDEFGYGNEWNPNEEGQGFSSAADLKTYLLDLKEGINADPNISPESKASLLSKISLTLLKVNQGSVGSAQRRDSLIAEAEAAIVEIEADLSIQPALKEITDQIETLKKTIEETDVSASLQSDKADLLEQLGKALSELELNQNSEAMQKAQTTLEEIQEGLDELQVEAETEKETNLETFEQQKSDLLEKIKSNGHLEEEDKEELETEVNAKFKELKPRLEKGEISPKDAKEALDEIDLAAGKDVKNKELIESFDNLSSKIPSDNDNNRESSEWFAGEVEKALNNNDWNKVNDYLDFLVKVGKDQTEGLESKWIYSDAENWWRFEDSPHIKGNGTNDVIVNLMGVLKYKIAEEDPKKLNELLNCFPKETRQKMEAAVLAREDEVYVSYGDGDAERAQLASFGSPSAVRDALQNSYRERNDTSKENYRITNSAESLSVSEE